MVMIICLLLIVVICASYSFFLINLARSLSILLIFPQPTLGVLFLCSISLLSISLIFVLIITISFFFFGLILSFFSYFLSWMSCPFCLFFPLIDEFKPINFPLGAIVAACRTIICNLKTLAFFP